MIQVTKPEAPDILVKEGDSWTQDLLDLVQQYNGYSHIPSQKKDPVVNKYRHKDIVDAVIRMTHGKCVFCECLIEASGYVNVEHFHPKAKYPHLTFNWQNLFPACIKCNNGKDKKINNREPNLVNPLEDDPEYYFTYNNLKILPRKDAPDTQKAEDTIINCDLQRRTLREYRATLMNNFYDYEKEIEKERQHFLGLRRNDKKKTSLTTMIELLDVVKNMSDAYSPYAGFVREVIRQSDTVRNCLNLIKSNHELVGLPDSGYQWGWRYVL